MAPYREKPDSYQLRIPGLTYKDEGNYTCVVSNPYGTIRHTFRLEVQDYLDHKPFLVEQSPNVTVLAGMTARFRCKFRSDLAVMVHWVRPKDEDDLDYDRSDSSSFRTLLDPETGDPVIGNELTVAGASADDAGMYFCVGQTTAGFATPGFLHLTVLDRDDAIPERPRNLSVAEGEDATFSCRTHLDLHRHTSWVRLLEGDIVELASGTEAVTIVNASESDSGVYACVVGTDEAHFQEVAYLKVTKKEDKEEGLAAPALLPVPSTAGDGAVGRRMSAIAGSVSVLAALLLVAILYMFRRYQQERFKKQQAIANAHSITQWTKKVGDKKTKK